MLNLDHYSGTDAYSEGAIEEELLSIAQEKSAESVLATDCRWPVLYHFSPDRRNLLEWLDFGPSPRVLEIGAGCGALTGLLCERSREVVSVELSRKRAEVIEARHGSFPNLAIYVGNLLDIPLEGKFDVITLIGVLEYAKSFGPQDAYGALLGRARRLLAPGGRLVVAIENQFGLKYWAGAKEDHVARYFEGLEGYPGTKSVETFSRQGLANLLNMNGFPNLEFYYPHPDYKLPTQIFSDRYLPANGFEIGVTPNYDQERIQLFSERLVMSRLIDGGLFPQFANSYLVIAKEA